MPAAAAFVLWAVCCWLSAAFCAAVCVAVFVSQSHLPHALFAIGVLAGLAAVFFAFVALSITAHSIYVCVVDRRPASTNAEYLTKLMADDEGDTANYE
jgi:hypothetical protein